MTTSRRLAAIFAADVAGYSRLMGADEEGTLARLKAVRAELVDPAIAGYHGRIFKTTGDGLLAEFPSVIEAVRCALAVQRATAERFAAASADRRLEFRIGVNVGDVIIDGDDIYGDGVNIAARLETLAEPGGICVSARVYEDATGRIDAQFVDGGEQALKNIGRPVRVYRVRIAEPAVPAAPHRGSEPTTAPSLCNIGYLGVAPLPWHDEFRRALTAHGHVEGKTIRIHYRWSGESYGSFPELARELIAIPVELIVAVASQAVVAAKQATSSVPIVMVEIGDPVGYGIVPSLMRPGGNVTGLSNALYEYLPRGLRLLKEIVPEAERVAILTSTSNPGSIASVKSLEEVAHALDLRPRVYHAESTHALRATLAELDRRTDLLVIAPDHGLATNRSMILAAAAERKVPVICALPEYARDGALLSLGPNRTEVHRRAAYYVDAILKGTPPSALPIEEPSKSWLALNLKTAQSLEITIPSPILLRADELIE